MPIKKVSEENRTEEIFQSLQKTQTEEIERLKKLPKKTTTISCRLLKSEKERIEKIVNQKGMTLAQALKRGLYELIEKSNRPI